MTLSRNHPQPWSGPIDHVRLVMGTGTAGAPRPPMLTRSSSFSEEPDTLVTTKLPIHWQSPSDLPERRLMVQRIVDLTRMSNRQHMTVEEWTAKAPSIARRVELSLYSRAASLAEYRDITTLRRRLQSLVALSYHEAATIAYVKRSTKKRSRSQSSLLTSAETTTVKKTKKTVSTFGRCFLFENEDLVRLVYEFINGTEARTHASVNRRARDVLPRCVSTLLISTSSLERGLGQHGPELLRGYFPNLTTLQVYGQARPDATSLHAGECKELELSHSNLGEVVLEQLALALGSGACPRLEHLYLLSLFSNTNEINGMRHLSQALASGACNRLLSLSLGGNSVADNAVKEFARCVLAPGMLPKLQRLDLRRNYIGEAGTEALMNAVASGSVKALRYLCLGGNIVTDESVETITNMLKTRSCPAMRFLGLEDNFISSNGVQHIMEAATSGGMIPKLHKICQRVAGSCLCSNNVVNGFSREQQCC